MSSRGKHSLTRKCDTKAIVAAKKQENAPFPPSKRFDVIFVYRKVSWSGVAYGDL